MVQPEEEIERTSQFNCETIRVLIDSMERMELGEESKFASYVSYLRTLPRGQLPETWSETGFRALCDIFELEGRSEWNTQITDFLPMWYKDCEGAKDNPLHEHLAMQVALRSEDDVMIPFYDMYNHRNGDWLNTRQKFDENDDSLEISARRTIEAGEQIYNSYNMCDGCGSRKLSFFDTFELFVYYGFVEQMPQRWNFLGQNVVFDLDEKKDDPDIIELTWATSVLPNQDMLGYMQEEIERITQLEQSLQEKQSSSPASFVPNNEWHMITQYLNAYRSALGHAISATEKLFREWEADGWDRNDWEEDEDEEEDNVEEDDEDMDTYEIGNDNSGSVDDPRTHLHHNVIQWIQSSGGIINEKQEIRLQDPLDPASGLGVFAAERIEEGEVLCMIPNDLMVQPEEEIERTSQFNCETIRVLIDSMERMELGEESKFASYVSYLRTLPRGQLPETWSETGFRALCDIFELEGRSEWNTQITDFLPMWYKDCEGAKDNPLHEHLAMQVALRSEDDVMIPFYDMYNHRNGDWLNTRQKFDENDDSLEISARRTIEAGEQIYNSYNMCDGCGSRKLSFFDTFELFVYYGFVEQMPQRWNFLGQNVVFDLDEKKDDPDIIELTWATSVLPNQDMLGYMQEEIERITQLEQSLQEKQSSSPASFVPNNEWHMITQYLNAYRSALGHAISATEKLFREWEADGWDRNDWEEDEDEEEDDWEEDDAEEEDEAEGGREHGSYLSLRIDDWE